MKGNLSIILPSPRIAGHGAALLLLLLITIVAALLRLDGIRESLWVDELHTSWTVSAGLAQIMSRAAMGNQSPLYFYMVWAVTETFGTSELTLRLPSLIAGVTLVPLLYLAVFRWTASQSAALMAAVLAALDANCLFYSQEARPYAMLQLLALWHVLVFWRLITAPARSARIGFVAGAVALFYWHYTSALLVAAELLCYVFLSFYKPWQPKYRGRWLLVDLALIAVLCLPAVPHVLQVAARRDAWKLFVEQLPPLAMLTLFPLHVYILLPLVLIGAAALLRWQLGHEPILRKIDPRLPLLIACWLFVPIVVAWVATYTDVARLFFTRYLITSALAPIACAGLLCATCPSKPMRLALMAFMLVAAVWDNGMIPQYVRTGRLTMSRNEDWRGAVQFINEQEQQRHFPVLVMSGLIEADALHRTPNEALRQYCLLPVTGIYQLDRPSKDLIPLPTTDSGLVHRDNQERISRRGGAWLVLRAGEATVDQVLSGLLHGGTQGNVKQRRSFGGVTVILIISHRPSAKSTTKLSASNECRNSQLLSSPRENAASLRRRCLVMRQRVGDKGHDERLPIAC